MSDSITYSDVVGRHCFKIVFKRLSPLRWRLELMHSNQVIYKCMMNSYVTCIHQQSKKQQQIQSVNFVFTRDVKNKTGQEKNQPILYMNYSTYTFI